MNDRSQQKNGSKNLEGKLDESLTADRQRPSAQPGIPAYMEQISQDRVANLQPQEVVRLIAESAREHLEIQGTLRLGNEGITYRTRDQNTGKERGLKIVRTKLGKNPDIIEKKARQTYEAINRTLGTNYRVGRANIADIYVTYDFVPGNDLESARKKTKEWTNAELTDFITQTMKQLAKLHTDNIVHRDIKPANVISNKIGEQRLHTIIDFGLARDTDDWLLSTAGRSNGTEGTVAYMRWNDTGKPDPRDDLYAVGKMVYFLRTGRHLPLIGEAAMLADKYKEAIESLRLDPVLKERVYRLIGIDSATAYKNAGEVVADLSLKEETRESEKQRILPIDALDERIRIIQEVYKSKGSISTELGVAISYAGMRQDIEAILDTTLLMLEYTKVQGEGESLFTRKRNDGKTDVVRITANKTDSPEIQYWRSKNDGAELGGEITRFTNRINEFLLPPTCGILGFFCGAVADLYKLQGDPSNGWRAIVGIFVGTAAGFTAVYVLERFGMHYREGKAALEKALTPYVQPMQQVQTALVQPLPTAPPLQTEHYYSVSTDTKEK